jgi:multiple sugar transport system substrate-binding protein
VEICHAERKEESMQRVLASLLLIALLIAGCGKGRSEPTMGPGFNWRQFEGTTLRVMLSQSHWQQIILPYVPEFEQLTGIRLAAEVYPQGELWDVLEKALGEPGRVDAFMTVPALDGRRFLRAGRIQPVNAFLRDPTATAPDYQWEDFLPRTRAAMEINGAILGPPVMGDHLALLYRKDILRQYQVAVPRTLDELEAAARFLHKKPMGPRGEPGVGIVSRGNGTAATSVYAGILHAMGASWLDGSRRPSINRSLGLGALERMGRLLGSYAPPNVSTFGWEEASSLFVAGGAAMYIEGGSIHPIIEDERRSWVAGKVGYALFPSGPGGPGTTMAVRGLAIAKQSANPKAAWLFLQWASRPDMVLRALWNGVLVGRESAWRAWSARGAVPSDLAQSFQEAGRIGNPQWAPPMVAVTSAREAVGTAIAAAIRGEDFRAAADAAAQRLTEILRTTE